MYINEYSTRDQEICMGNPNPARSIDTCNVGPLYLNFRLLSLRIQTLTELSVIVDQTVHVGRCFEQSIEG